VPDYSHITPCSKEEAALFHGRIPEPREGAVHDHGSEEGEGLSCREEFVAGRLRGQCVRYGADLDAGAPLSPELLSMIEEYSRSPWTDEHSEYAPRWLRALVARVRTAEAERDAAYAAIAGSPEKAKRIASLVASATRLVQIERDDARAALASRTVETAEEWEYVIHWPDQTDTPIYGWQPDFTKAQRILADSIRRNLGDDVTPILLRRRPAGPAEPVPPTPEEESRG